MNEIELARSISSGSEGNLIGGVIVILILAIPLVIKMMSWARETSANGTLYAQLAEQVTGLKAELDKVYIEKHAQTEELMRVKARLEYLENADSMVDTLKRRLDEKDRLISERDARIASLTEDMLRMKDRVHHLEMRLAQDEKDFCKSCTRPKSVVVV